MIEKLLNVLLSVRTKEQLLICLKCLAKHKPIQLQKFFLLMFPINMERFNYNTISPYNQLCKLLVKQCVDDLICITVYSNYNVK